MKKALFVRVVLAVLLLVVGAAYHAPPPIIGGIPCLYPKPLMCEPQGTPVVEMPGPGDHVKGE